MNADDAAFCFGILDFAWGEESERVDGEVGLRLSAVGWCVYVWRFVGAWGRCATHCVAGRSTSAGHSSSSSRLATAVRCHSRISCSMHMDPVGRNAYDSDFVFYAWIDRAGRRMERRRGRAKIRDSSFLV